MITILSTLTFFFNFPLFEDFSKRIVTSLRSYKTKKLLLIVFVLSMVIWLIEGIIVFFGFKAVNANVSIWSTCMIFPLACMLGILSFLPGGLGSIEFVLLLFFTTTYGLPKYQVMAGILISRFMSLWMQIITGTLLLPFLESKYKVLE